MKRNRNAKREFHTIKEVMISVSNLPHQVGARPNTFAILSVNLHSLDEHDKKNIGKLTDNEIHELNGEALSEESEEEQKQGAVLVSAIKVA